MNGRRRNDTNSQVGGNLDDSNYDGNCTRTSLLVRDLENFRPMHFFRLSVHSELISAGFHAVCEKMQCVNVEAGRTVPACKIGQA